MSLVRQPEYRSAFTVFRRFVGRTLTDIAHDRYYFNGNPDEWDKGTVILTFDGAFTLSLSLIGDGQSVTATNSSTNPIPGFDLDSENRCDWRRVSLTKEPPFSILAGLTLDRVSAEVCRFELNGNRFAFTFGWWLQLGAHRLGYFNIGDDATLYLDCDPPPDTMCASEIELVAQNVG